ncbi:MAG: chemoreceptor glutamine deamidase CheD, partial [Pseudomonadota bacterium]
MSTPDRRNAERRHAAAQEAVLGRARYFDAQLGAYVVKVPPGDHYVTKATDERVATTLGSCVAACIRDPSAGVGGLNHFLLPGDPRAADPSGPNAGMRYGQNAMERLVNDV